MFLHPAYRKTYYDIQYGVLLIGMCLSIQVQLPFSRKGQ